MTEAIKEPKILNDVTLVCIDCVSYGHAILAIKKSLKEITPAHTIFFTDIDFDIDERIEVVKIPRINSKKEYSKFMIEELGKYEFNTSHILVIQYDGYVLDGQCWNEDWLNYDYIGASWLETDGYNVGNGGFSLRSTKLCKVLSERFKGHHPEDAYICRTYRDMLEKEYNIKFAPANVADDFSFELREPSKETFGFHADFHEPYKNTIVIKRSGAIGDCIMIEPVIDYLCEKGNRVVLDFPKDVFSLFNGYKHTLTHIDGFDSARIKHTFINLDMTYEVNQKYSVLHNYYAACGIKDGVFRNNNLKIDYTPDKKLFNKYCVLAIDNRPTVERNVIGVMWSQLIRKLNSLGYTVIQVGHEQTEFKGAIRMKTPTLAFLKWVIGCADLFIGVDSGTAHIAVAQEVPSVIMFGSVNPEHIYHDFTNIETIQAACPIANDGCWHKATREGFTQGSFCEIDAYMPPCTQLTADDILACVDKLINKY